MNTFSITSANLMEKQLTFRKYDFTVAQVTITKFVSHSCNPVESFTCDLSISPNNV